MALMYSKEIKVLNIHLFDDYVKNSNFKPFAATFIFMLTITSSMELPKTNHVFIKLFINNPYGKFFFL